MKKEKTWTDEQIELFEKILKEHPESIIYNTSNYIYGSSLNNVITSVYSEFDKIDTIKNVSYPDKKSTFDYIPRKRKKAEYLSNVININFNNQ